MFTFILKNDEYVCNCLLFFRQTGHVTVDVELMTPTHCESCCLVQQMIGVAITDALKNVDCDLPPPIGELCGPQSQVGKRIIQ